MPRRATGYSLRGASFPVPTFKRALKMAKDRMVDRSLAKLRARIGRSLREEKEGGKPWPACDKSSADVAHNPCVRPLEGKLAVARLAVSVFAIRFAHILRNAAFGFAASLLLLFPFLSLSLSSFFLFFLLFLFSPSLVASFFVLRLHWLFASGTFFVHQIMDTLGRPACVSGLRLCFLRIAFRSSLRLPTL